MQSSEPGGARGAFWPALSEEFAWIWSFAGESQIYPGVFERELHPWLARLAAGIRGVVDVRVQR